MVNVKLLLQGDPLQTSPLPSACFPMQTLCCALVCPHMFSVLSPLARAEVIGKPGVLLFQRPGSMEREVILGPWRRAWERGGGRWADKNQTWLRQEHVAVHTHRPLCTRKHRRTHHSACTQICKQALTCSSMHIVIVCVPQCSK